MLETIRTLRRKTNDALAHAIDASRPEATEASIRDEFDAALTAAMPEVTPEGWYSPPPKGLIVCIANPPDYTRLTQPTFRSEVAWSSAGVRLLSESVLYGYGSRVDKATGLIADSGCTLYGGHNVQVVNHLRSVWALTVEVAQSAQVGDRLCDVYNRAAKMIERSGLANNVYSTHHGSDTNIGHSIPWTAEAITQAERDVLAKGTPSAVAELVGNKRIYVSPTEQTVIGERTAFTIEPRLSAPGLPSTSFHMVVVIEDGKTHVVTEFETLFERFEMTDFTL